MISDDVLSVFLLFMIVVNIIVALMIIYNHKKMLENCEICEFCKKKFNERERS